MRNATAIYVFLIVLTIIVLGGFYLIFNQLNSIQQVVLNSPGSGQNQSQTIATSTPISTPSNQTPTSSAPTGGVSIPANILFTIESSPALQPQTNVTVTVNSVTESPDGTITVNLKAFTSQASSYSSLNPADFLQIVDLSGNNETVLSTTGNWNSMPPQGGTTGTATFKVDPGATSIILQVGAPSTANYYKFDFSTQSYQQTVLG